MEERLEEILENVKAMRGSWTSFFVFCCFCSSWFTFMSVRDLEGEQVKTNTNLRTIINILNQDSILNPNHSEEEVKEKSTHTKTKK